MSINVHTYDYNALSIIKRDGEPSKGLAQKDYIIIQLLLFVIFTIISPFILMDIT